MISCYKGASMRVPQVEHVCIKWLQKSYKCMFITKDHINTEMKLWKLKKIKLRDSKTGREGGLEAVPDTSEENQY